MDIDEYIKHRARELVAMKQNHTSHHYTGRDELETTKGGAIFYRNVDHNPGKRMRRNEIVKRVMRETGMTLPQASRYVKEQGLY